MRYQILLTVAIGVLLWTAAEGAATVVPLYLQNSALDPIAARNKQNIAVSCSPTRSPPHEAPHEAGGSRVVQIYHGCTWPSLRSLSTICICFSTTRSGTDSNQLMMLAPSGVDCFKTTWLASDIWMTVLRTSSSWNLHADPCRADRLDLTILDWILAAIQRGSCS